VQHGHGGVKRLGSLRSQQKNKTGGEKEEQQQKRNQKVVPRKLVTKRAKADAELENRKLRGKKQHEIEENGRPSNREGHGNVTLAWGVYTKNDKRVNSRRGGERLQVNGVNRTQSSIGRKKRGEEFKATHSGGER